MASNKSVMKKVKTEFKTLRLMKKAEYNLTFNEWYDDLTNKDNYPTKEHALNKWNAMCELQEGATYGEYEFDCNDILDCEFDLSDLQQVSDYIEEYASEYNNVCERCDKITDGITCHIFGCVNLCDDCGAANGEPQCPPNKEDPCSWCDDWRKQHKKDCANQIKELEERTLAAK
jgi:hypothetical protein